MNILYQAASIMEFLKDPQKFGIVIIITISKNKHQNINSRNINWNMKSEKHIEEDFK